MIGGDFVVNTRGIQHYQQFGYKQRLAKSKLEIDEDLRKAKEWVTVPYTCNRGMVY